MRVMVWFACVVCVVLKMWLEMGGDGFCIRPCDDKGANMEGVYGISTEGIRS